MNTKAEIDRLTDEVCERLDLTLLEVMEVQVDLANDYLKRMAEAGFLADKEDAALMVMVPEFWAWWRQRWANRDRNLLDGLSKLAILEWHRSGKSSRDLYYQLCQHLAHPGGQSYPNDVIMAAFQAEKRKQNTLSSTLKSLFNA